MYNSYKIDLQFFASAESEGRTETATTKRREKAREEGQVAKSQELNTAVILLAYFGIMLVFGEKQFNDCVAILPDFISEISPLVKDFEVRACLTVVKNCFLTIISINWILWLSLMIIGILVNYVQVGYHPTMKPMKFKLSKFNPITGMKKIISPSTLVELLKSIAKVLLLAPIIYVKVMNELPYFFRFYDMEILAVAFYIFDIVSDVGLMVGGAYLFIAAADYKYQHYKHEDSIKMSKQDVKDEWKNSEGNPQVKAKIRQKMREASVRRMMQSVPQADVIITNPTHFAVAVFYDRDGSVAPVVVAKGVDKMAQRIKELAKEHNIQIVENKPLARTLYYTAEVAFRSAIAYSREGTQSNITYRANLAVAYENQKDIERARQIVAGVLAVDNDNATALEVRRRIGAN